jgi:hypothetical protein
MSTNMIMLLGRRDEPTDAVEEYCGYLSGALRAHSVETQLVRVDWSERGWPGALLELHHSSQSWRGRWVLVQYTALAWSARGFPRQFLKVLGVLRQAEARVGVVFHDVEPFAGSRVIDVLRRRVQLSVMRRTLRVAGRAFFPISLEVVSWLGDSAHGAVFIPVGANLPAVPMEKASGTEAMDTWNPTTGAIRIAVYGITGGGAGSEECSEIAEALRSASERGARLVLHAFGRGAAEREPELRDKLKNVSVELHFSGLLSVEGVAAALRESAATLFVRGGVSTRRGSALAGIACGRPVIAYRGAETAPPITEAGVVLVSRGNTGELGDALYRIATDESFRALLSERSKVAYQKYFAWSAIARRYVEELNTNT